VPPVRAHHDLILPSRCFVFCTRESPPPLWAAPATRLSVLPLAPCSTSPPHRPPCCLAPLSLSRRFFARCTDVVGSPAGRGRAARALACNGLRPVQRRRCCPLPSAAVRCVCRPPPSCSLAPCVCRLPLETCILTSLPSAPSSSSPTALVRFTLPQPDPVPVLPTFICLLLGCLRFRSVDTEFFHSFVLHSLDYTARVRALCVFLSRHSFAATAFPPPTSIESGLDETSPCTPRTPCFSRPLGYFSSLASDGINHVLDSVCFGHALGCRFGTKV
jgi:hypothetical protein